MELKLTNEDIADYSIDELKIGLEKSFQVELTQKLIDDFAHLSGDYNPLHTDKNFAQSKNFKTVVCHGMLLASFFSRIVGMYLPGKNSLYFSQSLNFIKPAFVNDTVTVSGKIIAKSNSTKIITLKMSICNIETELVSGEAKVFLNDSNHQIS